MLGCVRQVHELDMVVSLPNGLTGTVAITDFSDAYTSLLQALADGTESDLAEDKVCHLMRGFIFCRHCLNLHVWLYKVTVCVTLSPGGHH